MTAGPLPRPAHADLPRSAGRAGAERSFPGRLRAPGRPAHLCERLDVAVRAEPMDLPSELIGHPEMSVAPSRSLEEFEAVCQNLCPERGSARHLQGPGGSVWTHPIIEGWLSKGMGHFPSWGDEWPRVVRWLVAAERGGVSGSPARRHGRRSGSRRRPSPSFKPRISARRPGPEPFPSLGDLARERRHPSARGPRRSVHRRCGAGARRGAERWPRGGVPPMSSCRCRGPA